MSIINIKIIIPFVFTQLKKEEEKIDVTIIPCKENINYINSQILTCSP